MAIGPDTSLATMRWSGKRLLFEAMLGGERYQEDEMSAHRVMWKAMEAAGDDDARHGHIDFTHEACQFKAALQAQAQTQHRQRLKRAGKNRVARCKPKAEPKARPKATPSG